MHFLDGKLILVSDFPCFSKFVRGKLLVELKSVCRADLIWLWRLFLKPSSLQFLSGFVARHILEAYLYQSRSGQRLGN